MMARYTGDPAHDLLLDETLAIERRIRSTRDEILRRLEHGLALTDRGQRRRLRELREALAHRALLRDLARELIERDAEASW